MNELFGEWSIDCTQSVPMAALAASIPAQTPYIVDGVLAEGQPCLAFGREKCGKTSLCGVDLAFSSATGTKYLGHFDVSRKRRVLLLSGESGRAAITDSFLRICKARQCDPASVDGFVFSEWLPTLSNAASIKELGQRLVDDEIELAIVDPAGPCMSAGAGSTLSIAYGELRAFADVCGKHGATPILLHHATKGSDIGRLGLRAAAGAGFAEWARQWLILDRVGQFKPSTGEHRLRLTAGGSAGHAGKWLIDWREGNQSDPGGRVWDLSVRPAEGKRKSDDGDAKLKRYVDAVTEAMKPFAEFKTGKAIASAAKLNAINFGAAIAHLIETGAVIERAITRNGRQRVGYRLAKSGPV